MLSLYVHVPFCVRKCHYCGFYSTPFDERRADRYLDALEQELARYHALLGKRQVDTIFVGGGTPTTLTGRQVRRLFRAVGDRVGLVPDAEFTVEVNPGTAEEGMLVLLGEEGANRISIGVQSFNDEVLQRLGRVHTATQAAECIPQARKAGFKNIGIDLIFGVPGMTLSQWRRTLAWTIDQGVEHVSAYSLSVDEGSRLAEDIDSGRSSLPGDDSTVEQYETAIDLLEGAGFVQYEISNFAKPGRACRHNTAYWDRGEYVGLGPAAWSFLEGRRYANVRDLEAYVDWLLSGRDAVVAEEFPTPAQAASERLMLGLRKTDGIDLDRFAREFGPEFRDSLLSRVRRLDGTGLLRMASGRIVLTRQGMVLSNEVIARLIA